MAKPYPEELQKLRDAFIKDIQEKAKNFHNESEKIIKEKFSNNDNFQRRMEVFCTNTWLRLAITFGNQKWDYGQFKPMTEEEIIAEL